MTQRLPGRQGTVASAETKRVREAPPLPYDLGTLQQEADRLFGMGAQQVLDTVQALYETHKAVTYPRTDCPHLPESMLTEAPRRSQQSPLDRQLAGELEEVVLVQLLPLVQYRSSSVSNRAVSTVAMVTCPTWARLNSSASACH